jgi:galactose-1-phosphate uridylyltransferase
LVEFTEDMLADALLASQSYLRRVQEYDANAKYWLINWNYMPPAASSQIHPHLQVLAGPLPLAYHQVLLDASRKYRDENSALFWSDFIAEEKKLRERYIATIGNTVWLTSFVPRGAQLDVQAIFQERKSFLSLPQEDIESFCQGLTKIFKYMDDQNFYSFDLCLYSGVVGEDSLWTQARIIERGLVPPVDASDAGNIRLLVDTKISVRHPETVCQELKPYFAQQGKNKEE